LPEERRITIHEGIKDVMKEEVTNVEKTKAAVDYLLFKNCRDAFTEFYLTYKNSNTEEESNYAMKLRLKHGDPNLIQSFYRCVDLLKETKSIMPKAIG